MPAPVPLDTDRPILVTGAAGFIGSFVAERLLHAGYPVVGLDNLNAYYDVRLKEDRLSRLGRHAGFALIRADLANPDAVRRAFDAHRPDYVVHMAAQAGVRYSIDNPEAYGAANLTGFLHLLEGCRSVGCRHLVYASSSSVYGGNAKVPFAVTDSVDHPVSLYAATKKANELMAHSYASLYGLPATGLRFFTVYGPWGRPDMAYYKFTEAIFAGRPIEVFNNGRMERDFTFIADAVEAVVRLIPRAAAPDPAFDRARPNPGTSWAPHRIYNIGNDRPEQLMDMIAILERLTGREAVKEFRPMQAGDVASTWADVSDLEAAIGYRPETSLEAGLDKFVTWYRERHGI